MLVVDASVALKWVLKEEGRDAARALIGAERLIAPDFLILESANTLAMKVRRGLLSADDARRSLALLSDEVGLTFVPSRRYMAKAHDLALTLSRSAYDCLYLALAEAEGGVMVTADLKFVRAVVANPAYAALVRPLTGETD